jgi:FG-GAP repeat protein/hemolysin type calcium-binding protein
LVNSLITNIVELSALEQNNNNNGFVINGVDAGDGSGISVSSAGDVNGDGLADLIVGALHDDPNGNDSGASFVVFGKGDGTAVELSNIENGNGGFVINGVSTFDISGKSVSSAGDVNGDGLADLIVGAWGDDPNGEGLASVVAPPDFDTSDSMSGASFVVFGKSNGTAVELSDIEDGNGGFVINGVSADDRSGATVSSAGDVNGDGLADLIVGAWGDDPNGNDSGASFVVFGKSNGTAVELSTIENGNGGFVINGVNAYDQSGFSVSSAGDVNGDGLADLIVGAPGDDPNGDGSGASFVVFGKSNGTAIELSNIESNNSGFVINGVSTDVASGGSVSSAGDVNGDGFADLIVGAPGSGPIGISSGASFVIFGGHGTSATIGTTGDDTLTGDNSVNQLVAGTGNDTLVGNGGADVLRGGAGNDILAISDLTFASLDGGTGIDTLRFDAVLNLDLRTLADTKLMSIEAIDLINDGGSSTISLNLTDLLNLNEAQTASDTLVVHGNADDIVNLDNTSNGQTGSWANAGFGVYEFTAGGIGIIGTVTIDTAVTVNIIA